MAGALWLPAGRRAWGLEGRGMSVRAWIVRARQVAGRIAAVTAAGALLAPAAGVSAQPAAAGLVSGDSIPEVTTLSANFGVVPDGPPDRGRAVLSVPVTLQEGQTRLISDQLTVTEPKVPRLKTSCSAWIRPASIPTTG